ncbi:MAG: hypothetical protein AAF514_24755, partial [Verrucomicrobiota bacterium]
MNPEGESLTQRQRFIIPFQLRFQRTSVITGLQPGIDDHFQHTFGLIFGQGDGVIDKVKTLRVNYSSAKEQALELLHLW